MGKTRRTEAANAPERRIQPDPTKIFFFYRLTTVRSLLSDSGETSRMIDTEATTDAIPAPQARLNSVSRLFGAFAALRQVTVDFRPGQCYVLLGENGAGKSTMLRILAGLLHPSAGEVTVFGKYDPHSARHRIGYMSHAPMLYDELTGLENLEYFRSLYPGSECLEPAEALRQVGLDPALTRTLGQY